MIRKDTLIYLTLQLRYSHWEVTSPMDRDLHFFFLIFNSSTRINDCEKATKAGPWKWATSYVYFAIFVKFVQDLARFRNDPSDQKILYPSHQNAQKSGQKMDLPVHKTTLASDENTSSSRCPIHDKNSNQVLCDCLKLHKKPYKEQIAFLLYPPRTKFRGYIGITLSVRLSVCPSVCADSCPGHNCFMVWHWLTIFGTSV